MANTSVVVNIKLKRIETTTCEPYINMQTMINPRRTFSHFVERGFARHGNCTCGTMRIVSLLEAQEFAQFGEI